MPIKICDPKISIVEIRSRLDYCHKTGVFKWKIKRPPKIKPGDIAGCSFPRKRSGGNYWAIKINSKRVLAHRLAWAIFYGEWPDGEVDHINGEGTDNRIENLRVCDRNSNLRNKRVYHSSKSGVPGVMWREKSSTWYVRIGGSYIGSFYDFLDAVAARKSAEKDRGYHPNHGHCGSQQSRGVR